MMVKPVRTYRVHASLPAALEPLRTVAHNLRWSWNHDAIALFRRLDQDLWETTGHNPVRLLGEIGQTQLQAAAEDESFVAHLGRVAADLNGYVASRSTWFDRVHGGSGEPIIAYFSAEFGITECLSIFAGGLGLLAGDHLKSASDLGVPLVGVGLLYQQGYFRQYLNDAGWQQEAYETNDFHNLPLTLERCPNGAPVVVEITLPDRTIRAQVWHARVGRLKLYLLDTNIEGNQPTDRDVTDQLYGGDLDLRLRQEIVLGIGGCRALEAVGIHPRVYHMNEGHAGFLALERIRRVMERDRISFAEAREAVSAGLIFTTHTPVPAGHDYFSTELMRRYFRDYAGSLQLSFDELMGLGRANPTDPHEPFGMTILALRLAAHSNGVSRLHGKVSRGMWRHLWPGVPEDEVPIGHVTNGVHFRSWIHRELDELYDRYLGLRWADEPGNQRVWQGIERVPAEELWRSHERRRERLVAYTRRRLRAQLERRGAPQAEVEAADDVLDVEALTIGFGRRFATYKRATLLLRDPERLARILRNPNRPVQVIFAGKAHPRDDAGKELIRKIVDLSRQEPFRRRLVFLEDYDVAVARQMVQGADVWLNTPLRPLEASGTSGMKATANGVLNLSTLDGWWDEAWRGPRWSSTPIGWAIGRGESYDDREYQDAVEAEALYDLLERDVVPTFYERGVDGVPRQWIARVKSSLQTLCFLFNTHRMVQEYTERFYLTAAKQQADLADQDSAGARALAVWRSRVCDAWPSVRVEGIDAPAISDLHVGEAISIQARVHLGELTPDDVVVQLYSGRVDTNGELTSAEALRMQPIGLAACGSHLFELRHCPCRRSGLLGFTVRVVPYHTGLPSPFVPGLLTWSGPEVVTT
ncbi:MAG: alpha-glucan family phosphorylase [Chloroflexi bacterium]|nr:alpha-glucan family phosphorylase [Chloroflexota bacterium]